MAEIDLRIVDKISWLMSKPKRVKIAVGSRGSAKSVGVGDLMLMFADSGERVCCAREFQNSIDDSVHESLKDEIDRLDVEGFTVLESEIRASSGGRIFYKGLARNITSLKSLAGVHRLWIEEGESVSEKSLRVLTPSIRSTAASNKDEDADPPEIWITMNRGRSTDAIAVKYLERAEDQLRKTGYYEDDMCMIVEVNYRDNPWFPPELEQERLDDYEHLSRAEYDHIWEGEYGDQVDNALIKPEWFDACIDAHQKLGWDAGGLQVLAHDPADSGKDDKALAFRRGSVIEDVQLMSHGDVNDACDWALDYAHNNNAEAFVWDEDGMGTGLRRQISSAFDGRKVEVSGFRGGAGVDNPEHEYDKVRNDTQRTTNKDLFFNKRAQYYGELRDRCYRTYLAVFKGKYQNPDDMIGFSSEIQCLRKVRSEITSVPFKNNGAGRLQILSKPEMKKLGIASPNAADAVMMSLSVNSVAAWAAADNWSPPKVNSAPRSASRYSRR